jgi:hypothetical protein
MKRPLARFSSDSEGTARAAGPAAHARPIVDETKGQSEWSVLSTVLRTAGGLGCTLDQGQLGEARSIRRFIRGEGNQSSARHLQRCLIGPAEDATSGALECRNPKRWNSSSGRKWGIERSEARNDVLGPHPTAKPQGKHMVRQNPNVSPRVVVLPVRSCLTCAGATPVLKEPLNMR